VLTIEATRSQTLEAAGQLAAPPYAADTDLDRVRLFASHWLQVRAAALRLIACLPSSDSRGWSNNGSHLPLQYPSPLLSAVRALVTHFGTNELGIVIRSSQLLTLRQQTVLLEAMNIVGAMWEADTLPPEER